MNNKKNKTVGTILIARKLIRKNKNNVDTGNLASAHAITLISLVITIIILIILAGVGINLTLGENGIFNKAKEAKEITSKQEATEKINLKITTAQMNKYAEKQEMPTLKELSEVLKEDSEIQYVTETSKVASAEYNVPSKNPSSIFTKLNKYPYEFEINSSLQLASINGVKIAVNNENETGKLKKLGTLTGAGSETSNYLELPNCNEILVSIKVNGDINYSITMNIPYQELTNDIHQYGGGTPAVDTGWIRDVWVKCSSSKIWLDSAHFGKTNYSSTSVMDVYYK